MKCSNRKSLCVIYNFAQHYRSNIFKLMNDEFHCDFIFGNKYLDVKKMDYSTLDNVKEVENRRLFGHWYFQKGIIHNLWKYKQICFVGDVFCLSTWIMLFLAKFTHTKTFIWGHGWYGKESFWAATIKKIYMHLANGILLYGDYARNLMIKKGFKESHLHVIYNSLDYDNQLELRNKLKSTNIYKEYFGNTNYNLIFIGRLTQVKRLDILLETVKIINSGEINVNLTLIGDGQERNFLESKVDSLSLNNVVWFYGPCYDEKIIASLIYNADLCVSPGNVGLTAMHALSFGTPVITHNDFCWQMPEFEAIIEGKTGSFFKNGDIDDLAIKILNWLKFQKDNRDNIRLECFNVIDSKYNPHYQLNVMKKIFQQ